MVTAVQIARRRRIGLAEDEIPEASEGQVQVHSLYSRISHGIDEVVSRNSADVVPDAGPSDARLPDVPGTLLAAALAVWVRVCWPCGGPGAGVTTVREGDVVFCFAPLQAGKLRPAGAGTVLPRDMEPLTGVFLANLSTTLNGILDADLHLQESAVVVG